MKPNFDRAALKFVILLGMVSLCADMTYEGARSITGPYLAVLGASGTVVGLVAGLGELIGYGLRLVGGSSDESSCCWDGADGQTWLSLWNIQYRLRLGMVLG